MARRRLVDSAIILTALFVSTANAQEGSPPKLRMDVSLYPYQRAVDNDVDFTTTINASLPGRFSYFGYVNVRGVVTDGNAVFARSEQNLRYAVSDSLPIDLNFQGVLVRGDGNDFYQLGLGWRVHDTTVWRDFFKRINLVYRITFQVKRFEFDDSDAWQIEHFFRMNLTKRLYLSGFVDQTFKLDTLGALPSTPIVTEIQLGVRLFDKLYAISEYRRNDFRIGNEENLAAGLEYKFRW
ncbi:MAG: hypothetical protein OER97_03685 [Gammaproteobacteria bacterium]|nr:hypothetical protein [Gammaproteobacteria bacterium]